MTESNFKNNKEEIFLLVQKAKNGDTLAFGQIYEHYFTPIYRYVYFRIGNKAEAEDLTQVVFLKTFEALPNFQEKGAPFSAWLYKIARNTIIDHWKKKTSFSEADVFQRMNLIKDEKLNPAASFERKETFQTIQEAIKELSDDQQEVIILKFINDLSNQEIAKLLEKGEEAIRALSYRGLKALRQNLDHLL